MYKTKHKNWSCSSNNGVLKVAKGEFDGIEFSPSEGALITDLLHSALKMQSLPVQVDAIRNAPITLRFDKQGTLTLYLENDFNNNVTFNWDDVDDLMVAVQETVKMSIDEKTLNKR